MLGRVSSHELTEWQGYYLLLKKEEREAEAKADEKKKRGPA